MTRNLSPLSLKFCRRKKGGTSDNSQETHKEKLMKRKPSTFGAYDAVVLSSGGTKGISHLGCMEEIIKTGMLETVRYYVGTSAGAVVATTLALHLNPRDVLDACILPFTYEKDLHFQSMGQDFGIDRGSSIEKFLKSIVSPDMTFRDVSNEFGSVLSIIGTNLSTSNMEVFDVIRCPEMSVLEALRISCCVPFLFTAISKNNQYFVDGGISNPFPVDVALDYGCQNVLGCRFEAFNRSITNYPWKFEQYVHTVVDTLVNKPAAEFVQPPGGARVDICNIQTPRQVSSLAFDLSTEDKLDMFRAGQESAKSFLKKHH